MKNYHAVGIAIAAVVILACSVSLARAEERPAICPTATDDNSGIVITDENNDGEPDTIWEVYIKGACAGWTVDPENTKGTPYEE